MDRRIENKYQAVPEDPFNTANEVYWGELNNSKYRTGYYHNKRCPRCGAGMVYVPGKEERECFMGCGVIR